MHVGQGGAAGGGGGGAGERSFRGGGGDLVRRGGGNLAFLCGDGFVFALATEEEATRIETNTMLRSDILISSRNGRASA